MILFIRWVNQLNLEQKAIFNQRKKAKMSRSDHETKSQTSELIDPKRITRNQQSKFSPALQVARGEMDKHKSIVMNQKRPSPRPSPKKTQPFTPHKFAPTRRVSKKYVRISTCHDFQWSRGLWREASREIVGTATLCLFAYVFAASLLAYFDGVRGVDIPYFIAACVTTVGIGDISPQSQAHRAATVLMLPFGLLIISLCLSAAEARAKATAPTMDPEDLEEEERENNSVNIGSIRNERSLKKMHVWYKKKENRGAETRQKLVKVRMMVLTFYFVSFGGIDSFR